MHWFHHFNEWSIVASFEEPHSRVFVDAGAAVNVDASCIWGHFLPFTQDKMWKPKWVPFVCCSLSLLPLAHLIYFIDRTWPTLFFFLLLSFFQSVGTFVSRISLNGKDSSCVFVTALRERENKKYNQIKWKWDQCDVCAIECNLVPLTHNEDARIHKDASKLDRSKMNQTKMKCLPSFTGLFSRFCSITWSYRARESLCTPSFLFGILLATWLNAFKFDFFFWKNEHTCKHAHWHSDAWPLGDLFPAPKKGERTKNPGKDNKRDNSNTRSH